MNTSHYYAYSAFSNHFKILKSLENWIVPVSSINVSKNSAIQFVGFILKSRNLINEIHQYFPISAILIQNSEIKYSVDGVIKLFRPTLTATSKINEITITDDSTEQEIYLIAEKMGFGDILIKIECMIGGRITSYGGNLLDEIYVEVIQNLFELFLEDVNGGWSKQSLSENGEEEERSIKFEDEFLNTVFNHIAKKMDQGLEIMGDIEEDEKQLFDSWFEEYFRTGNIEQFLPILIENTLVNHIKRSLGENPSEATNLIGPKFRVNSRIKSPVEKLDIHVQYRDTVLNEYEPIIIPIRVIDNRENPSKIFIKLGVQFSEMKDNSIIDVERYQGGG